MHLTIPHLAAVHQSQIDNIDTQLGINHLPQGVEYVADIRELMAVSDHVVIALPSTPQTRHIVNAASLAAAKPGLHLINVARGALIDDQALLAALESGRVGAATLDECGEGAAFVKMADERLYRAKRGGRNRLVWA